MGKLRQISIANVQAEGANKVGCSITGLPGFPAEAIALDNIRIRFAGGGTEAEAKRTVPENQDKYPEYSMFGSLPAYGFYCRHVKGLMLRNLSLSVAAADSRPPLVAEDVEDIEITGLQAASSVNHVISLKDTRQAFIHGCRAPEAPAYLQVEGQASQQIKLLYNDLSAAAKPFFTSPEVPPTAIIH
jgi:hypothetical protein